MTPFNPTPFFDAVDLTGVVANGLLGGAVARSHRFDIVGFVTLGICTGLGGGVIRDLLLGQTFPVALIHPAYLPAAIAASCAAYLLDLRGVFARRLLLAADVLSLGCWAATGTGKAFAYGLAWLPCLIVGLVTAIGGGVLRDVLVGRVPGVFGGRPLYATVALAGCLEMLVCVHHGLGNLGMGLSILTCGLLGPLARRRGWVLPGALSLSPARPVRASVRRARALRRHMKAGRPLRAPRATPRTPTTPGISEDT